MKLNVPYYLLIALSLLPTPVPLPHFIIIKHTEALLERALKALAFIREKAGNGVPTLVNYYFCLSDD